jgi:GNAT superfamily N-acetyltransferase
MHECKKQAELIEGYHQADFFRAAPTDFQQQHGLYLEETSSYIATLTKSADFKMYNRVFALGVASPVAESELEHLLDLYRQAGLPFVIRLSPEAQPSELTQWLEARGFTVGMRTARFFRKLDEPVSIAHHWHIVPVTAELAPQFAYIASREQNPMLQKWLLMTLERPGWYHYVATDNETPIATGVLYIRDKVGWLGWASTLPAHRRKGAHQALLAHRINEARKLGCILLSAETREDTPEEPNPSYHNLLRMGFQFAYLRSDYVYQPPPPGS